MGSSSSKERKAAKKQQQAAASSTTSNKMSSSNAQVPKPSEVPSGAADASHAAKSSSKTANYFELVEVSHPFPHCVGLYADVIRTDELSTV